MNETRRRVPSQSASIAQWVRLRTVSSVLPLSYPSNSVTMWVTAKCQVKDMPVIDAVNDNILRWHLPSCSRCYGALVLSLRSFRWKPKSSLDGWRRRLYAVFSLEGHLGGLNHARMVACWLENWVCFALWSFVRWSLCSPDEQFDCGSECLVSCA
jgi:hypothetical protein